MLVTVWTIPITPITLHDFMALLQARGHKKPPTQGHLPYATISDLKSPPNYGRHLEDFAVQQRASTHCPQQYPTADD